MRRISPLLACLASLSFASLATAQFQNPAGFLDPAGANRAGTAAPPNTTIGPIGGSTLPPGAPSAYSPGGIETNSALRQELRRPFGGGYRRRAAPPSDGVIPEGTGDVDAGDKTYRSNRPVTTHIDAQTDMVGPAIGKLARDWRYVYFRGRHWYWLPNNTWDVWHNSGWVPYRRGMFSKPYFGYGTQVRGYRALPPDYQAGSPVASPGESASLAPSPADAEDGSAAKPQAHVPTGDEKTYSSPFADEPAALEATAPGPMAEPRTAGASSSPGPPMPIEHFISP